MRPCSGTMPPQNPLIDLNNCSRRILGKLLAEGYYSRKLKKCWILSRAGGFRQSWRATARPQPETAPKAFCTGLSGQK